MGGKEFNGYIEEYDGDIDKEGFKYCWEDYDGDIEEEYFACRPYFKSKSYLINARMYLKEYKDENIKKFIDRILRYANMKRCPFSETQNILIVNGNRKFTFLNTTKRDIGNRPCLYDLSKKGETKLRREYEDRWIEGYDDDKRKFSVLWVRSCGREEDEDDDNEFITACERIKAKYFNS